VATVLIVEPNPGGHRFQYVRYVVQNLPANHEPVLLTSVGASTCDEYRFNLGDIDVRTLEVFAGAAPAIVQLAEGVAAACKEQSAAIVLLMDADVALKTWWWVARRWLRPLTPRPEISILLTRYPMRSALRDRRAMLHRVAKGAATLLGMLSGTITRASAIAGHEDTTRGLLISRVRDPAFCSAHSRDRARLRAQFGLPAERKLVGVFGRITVDKNIPMLAEAVRESGEDVDLLIVGQVSSEVADWLAGQTCDIRDRIVVRPGFLAEDVMDGLLAACDVVSVVQNYDRPSAVMGRALAAEVPLVTGGSRVRERELRLIGGGLATQTTPGSIAEAVGRLLASKDAGALSGTISMPTPEELTMTLLGHRGQAVVSALHLPRTRP